MVVPPAPKVVSERLIIFLIGAIQFVNILDFVMVMPLGPDFARELGIDVSLNGVVGGSYTLAAGVSGIACSFFLEAFDRRKALAVAMLGLIAATALGGCAQGLGTLLAARVLAGLFGGPATSLCLSIIADVVPPERRGRAIGTVMGAFSIAAIIGVPIGLWLAEQGSWRTPFFAVSALGLVVTAGAAWALPPLRGHLAAYRASRGAQRPSLFRRRDVLLSYSMTAVTMGAGFVLIPHISAYVQHNLGLPRTKLEEVYFFGGIASFLTMRIAGWLVDRQGSFRTGTLGTLLLAACIFTGFYREPHGIPIVLFFVWFMVSMGFRNVSYSTLTSKVPGPGERARFMSFQSAVQNFASALGAMVSSRLLSTGAGGKLIGMPRLALVSLGLTAVLPLLLFLVERKVRSRAALAPPPPLNANA